MSTGMTRPAAVAGTFYPADPEVLRRTVDALFAAARTRTGVAARPPKALIAPHAGYVYSGPVAASAYASIAALRGRVSRVVLMGPCHRVAVRGLALPGTDAFATPLGKVEIDVEAARSLAVLPQVVVSAAAHAQEHCLEVHLPFLQRLLGEFRLLPLLVGDATPGEVSQVLDQVWGGSETLVIISSDLSHYLDYNTAQRTDRQTVERMLALNAPINHAQACGATPVNGLIDLARRRALTPHFLALCNSGDTAGDKSRVVGYASIAFLEPDNAAPERKDADGDQGEVLLSIARGAIGRAFGIDTGAGTGSDHPLLREHGASFVTLKRHTALRGCIGSLVAHRPLFDDVSHNARAAAFSDPRFNPLSHTEFEQIRVEVSLLSAATPLEFRDEADVLRQLRPDLDGIVLEYGAHRATFLPQVWESLPNPRDFLAQLKSKARLPRDFWADGIRISRYTVDKWAEI